MADSYVCSGAMMRCTMGTSLAKLTVLPTKTVNLTGQPQANISDNKTMVNLAPFGLCRSLGFPATASATAAAMGTLTPMPCMHNTPMPWMGGKMDYLIKGQPALLKSCKCQCMWGGTISLVTDGQIGEGTKWVQKKQEINYSYFNDLYAQYAGYFPSRQEQQEYYRVAGILINQYMSLSETDRERVLSMISEMPDNLSNLEKMGIAENNIQIEKTLGIQKGEIMSIEEADEQSANPNHTPKKVKDSKGVYVNNPNYDEQYSINCATCAPTYALRLRGFDITAKGNKPENTLNEWVSHQHSFEIWQNIDGTPAQPTLTKDWMSDKGYSEMNQDRYEEFFEENCKEEGVYVLTVGWEGGGGHATILQRDEDGQLYYIEPQSYNSSLGARRPISYISEYAASDLATISNRGIMRVDNKVFDTNYLPLFSA